MAVRTQQTLSRPAEVRGIGFVTGADLRVVFLPAEAGHGITFTRTDRPELEIPALVEFTAPRSRRTALELRGVTIDLVEHVLAALAGLRIDNCRVLVNGPELPGCDGSSRAFVEALLDAEIAPLDVPRNTFRIPEEVVIHDDHGNTIRATPTLNRQLTLGYELDYGPGSPIPAQSLELAVHPGSFLQELAFARTFVLQEEVAALQAQGIGLRLSARDLLVYGPQGVIDNELRASDECVRHKILDCIGDFALLGCDLIGHVHCSRTGHRQNADLVRALRRLQDQAACDSRRAA